MANTNELKQDVSCRVFVNKEADEAITKFLDDVNQNFNAGRATRLDAASFMINWFNENAPDDVVSKARRQLANGVTMLDAVYKMAKAGEELPLEVKMALEKHFFGIDVQSGKKGKNNLKQEYINDKLKESESL